MMAAKWAALSCRRGATVPQRYRLTPDSMPESTATQRRVRCSTLVVVAQVQALNGDAQFAGLPRSVLANAEDLGGLSLVALRVRVPESAEFGRPNGASLRAGSCCRLQAPAGSKIPGLGCQRPLSHAAGLLEFASSPSSGRNSGSRTCPCARSRHCRSTFCNSRMLPGQEYAESRSIAAGNIEDVPAHLPSEPAYVVADQHRQVVAAVPQRRAARSRKRGCGGRDRHGTFPQPTIAFRSRWVAATKRTSVRDRLIATHAFERLLLQ